MTFNRYAVYFTPTGALAEFGARWLGWDIATGRAVNQPETINLPAPLDSITETPRRYGFHATVKSPFKLAENETQAALDDALAVLCRDLVPVPLSGLELAPLGRFLALVPCGDAAGINRLAAKVVEDLDRFRAALPDAERARRRTDRLSPAQAANLNKWGYPYVKDEFRFHMTLTGRLERNQIEAVHRHLSRNLPAISAPFIVDALSLVGEDGGGCFHLIKRHRLSG